METMPWPYAFCNTAFVRRREVSSAQLIIATKLPSLKSEVRTPTYSLHNHPRFRMSAFNRYCVRTLISASRSS